MVEPKKQMYTRSERPKDLHPLLVEVHEVWLGSGMPMSQVAVEIGVSSSALYGWFMGRGKPTVKDIEALLNLFGYRFTVSRGLRRSNAEPTA